jgi:hypothetical protein
MKSLNILLTALGILYLGTMQGQEVKSRHELSIYGTGGYSNLEYTFNRTAMPPEREFVSKANKTSGGFGIGYTFSLYPYLQQWNIVTGAELALYSAEARANILSESSPNRYSFDGRYEEMFFNSAITGYSEKQSVTYFQIPLMLEFRMPKSDKHKWYMAAGAKFGFVFADVAGFAGKYTAKADRLVTTGYLPAGDKTLSDMPDNGFANLNNVSWNGDLDFGFNVSLTAETGLRWALSDCWGIYAGVFVDYGLKNISPMKNTGAIVRYQESRPQVFSYNSILTARHPSGEAYVDKINLLSIGLKVKIALRLVTKNGEIRN